MVAASASHGCAGRESSVAAGELKSYLTLWGHNGHIDRQTNRHSGRERETTKHTSRPRDNKNTVRQTDNQTYRQGRETTKHTGRERERDR